MVVREMHTIGQAQTQYQAQFGKYAAALAELERIKDPDARYAGAMFVLMARTEADLGNPDKARQFAAEAKKYVLGSEDAKSLDALLNRLDHPASKDDDDDAKRPTLRYRNPGKTK